MTCLINHQLPGNSIKLKLSPPLPWFLRSQRYPYFIEWIVAWTGASACDGKDKSINGIKIRIPMPGVGPVLASSLLKVRKLNNLVRVIMIFAALCMQTEHVTRHGGNLIMNQVRLFHWQRFCLISYRLFHHHHQATLPTPRGNYRNYFLLSLGMKNGWDHFLLMLLPSQVCPRSGAIYSACSLLCPVCVEVS